jgi:hypothetical protein
MSSRVDLTVDRLRDLALRGFSTPDLLEHAISSLKPDLSPLTFIACFKQAFGIPLFTLRDQVEGWVGLDLPGCTMPTQDVSEAIHFYVQIFLAKSGAEG